MSIELSEPLVLSLTFFTGGIDLHSLVKDPDGIGDCISIADKSCSLIGMDGDDIAIGTPVLQSNQSAGSEYSGQP